MAFIDTVRWAPQGDLNIYAWRFPETNLSTLTQLIVQESQEAVLFSKGKIIGEFGPGKHNLSTENLPLLRNFYGIPFGGKNPFTAEVWFVNKALAFNIDWSTDKMAIHDADYNTQLPLRALGQYGLKVVNSKEFLTKIVGPKEQYTEHDLTSQFYGEFCTKTKSTILQYMLNNNIGYKKISAYLDIISEYLKNSLSQFWSNLGLELTKFYVSSIEIDDTTEEGRRIGDAISRQSSMYITGHTWQQEQAFNTANNAIDGIGGQNAGLIGGLMAMNMMGGMGGNMLSTQHNQPSFGGTQDNRPNAGNNSPQPRVVYCSQCSKKYSSNMRFCPHCGDAYNPCPKCGSDNDEKAKRCLSCGTSLEQQGQTCPQCNAPLSPGASFCGFCGARIASSDVCACCGAPLMPQSKFCPICGTKR